MSWQYRRLRALGREPADDGEATAILCLSADSALIYPLLNRLFADPLPNPFSLCNLGRALRLGSDPKKL